MDPMQANSNLAERLRKSVLSDRCEAVFNNSTPAALGREGESEPFLRPRGLLKSAKMSPLVPFFRAGD